MRRWVSLWVVVLICWALASPADDLQYVSRGELEAEIARREEDIGRTRLRLAELARQGARAEEERQKALVGGRDAEVLAIARAGMLYRISRQGGSLRYLLNANSAVDLMARIHVLKRLLFDSLESRREAGLRIAAARKQVISVNEEKRAAAKMLEMLEETLAELEHQRKPRAHRSPAFGQPLVDK